MARVLLGSVSDFPEGKLKTVKAGEVTVVVAKTSAGFCAVKNQCAHLPLPLAGGKLEGDNIVCPFHGSTYNLCTGENQDWVTGAAGLKLPKALRSVIAMGKKPQGITSYAVTEENGQLYAEIG